jgi:hypothetical protein
MHITLLVVDGSCHLLFTLKSIMHLRSIYLLSLLSHVKSMEKCVSIVKASVYGFNKICLHTNRVEVLKQDFFFDKGIY